MDKHGIGTDATHAEHIEKIKERQYVTLNPDKRFIPGYLGLALVDAYNEMGFELSKPLLRATLESQLAKICTGELTKDVVLQEQLRCYKRIFQSTEDRIVLLSDMFKRYLDMEGGGVQNAVRVALESRNPNPTNNNGRGRPRGGRGRGRSDEMIRIPAPSVTGRPPITHQPAQRYPRPPVNPVRPFVNNPIQGQPANVPQGTNPNCGCGVPSVLRTANTVNNRGRQFYTCSKSRDDTNRCSYFQWIN